MSATETNEAGQGRNLELAVDRTLLANERTYASWLRTGLCALTAGLAIEKFMVDVLPFWGIRIISVILIMFSAFVFLLAAWRHAHLRIGGNTQDLPRIPVSAARIVSIFLALCSLLALIGLWLVPLKH
ncbi:MAG: YidH family protein [Hyphomicrobiales bacterium]